MLRTKGRDIIDETGKVIRLRGINLGSWALMESNMMGIPGVESRVKRGIELYAGREKAERFFGGVFDKWVTEDDIAFLKGLNLNSVRLPVSYRRFESDDKPYEYKHEGFSMIDRCLEYCRKYKMYVVIDMHVAQGFQNGDWHSDNPFGHVGLYTEQQSLDRFKALWKQIAERYRDEEWVAGYDIMNEPVVSGRIEEELLNRVYREVVGEIRKVDQKHIVFIEGNYWSTDFSQIAPPFDGNAVYSSHYYCPAAIQPCSYPGPVKGEPYSIDRIRKDMEIRDEYMNRHNVPTWVGEFGVRRFPDLEDKNKVFRDYLTVFEENGDSWCYWNFKDLGLRGPLYINPDGPWVEFTREICRLKDKYHTDYANDLGDAWDLSTILGGYEEGDFLLGYEDLLKKFTRVMRGTLGDMLTEPFGKQFEALSLEDIDRLTDCFLFKNCLQYTPWAEILKSFCPEE